MIRNPSTTRTSPAPRDDHTLYLSVFNNASLSFSFCENLFAELVIDLRRQDTIHRQRGPNAGLAIEYAKSVSFPSTPVSTTVPNQPSCTNEYANEMPTKTQEWYKKRRRIDRRLSEWKGKTQRELTEFRLGGMQQRRKKKGTSPKQNTTRNKVPSGDGYGTKIFGRQVSRTNYASKRIMWPRGAERAGATGSGPSLVVEHKQSQF
jgi:hypothetical protein